jgi:hypothetical protein
MNECTICEWVRNPLVFAAWAVITGVIIIAVYWMDRR